MARIHATALAVVLAVVAACGAPAGGHDADVTFATMMVPHHAQAVAMAKLAATRAASPAVRELATQISAEQVPEIAQLQWMLDGWGEPRAPTATMADMPGMADSMPGMAGPFPGMMTARQMDDLRAASGPAFDRAFLQMMISHHEGGVAMATTELSAGSDPDAQLLAQNIVDAQQREIAIMQGLLH